MRPSLAYPCTDPSQETLDNDEQRNMAQIPSAVPGLKQGQRRKRWTNFQLTLSHRRVTAHPANTIHWAIVGSMLGQRRRRWTNIEPTMAQSLMFSGLQMAHIYPIYILGIMGLYYIISHVFNISFKHGELYFISTIMMQSVACGRVPHKILEHKVKKHVIWHEKNIWTPC